MQKSAILLLAFLWVQVQVNAGDYFSINQSNRIRSTNIKATISGKVVDVKTGEALPGAYVYFIDDKIGTVADAQGKYILTNIPLGHHVIEISHTGYSSLVEHIEINANMERDFALSPVIVENQGVIVTGISGATSIRNVPVPITSIRKSTLLQTPSSNIIDALSHVPGVSQLSTGPAISKPIIRGLGANRVVTIKG